MEKGEFVVGRQGEGATEVFSGKSKNASVEKMYGESAPYFAKIIKNSLEPKDLPYEILDVGTFKGELLDKVIIEMGDEYKFHKIGIDLEAEALAQNDSLDEKVLADAIKMPFQDKSVDVALCRYVLQWNTAERQKKIIAELQRICREFFIIQHGGADSDDTNEWKERVHKLVFGGVSKVSRSQGNFSSAEEIERWMSEIGVSFLRIQDRQLTNLSSIFAEKYKLTDEETVRAKNILGDKDYIYQTTWIAGDNLKPV